MFNGIIYNQGVLKKISKTKKGFNIFIHSNLKLTKKKIGMSVCCDGVCLTVISFKSKIAEFYLSNETLKRSNFNRRKLGDTINLELPLRHGQDISGHVCQGHVDTVGKVTKIKKNNKSTIIDFVLTKSFKNQLIEKASILINGVSLTIAKITKNGFSVWAIPHTLKLTNLSMIKKNDIVNIEIDILSKYVKKYLNEKK
jgi:riboflavin synthase